MKLARSLLPAAILLAMATAPWPAHAEVRIGLAAPLTGNQAWAGGETREGAEIAVADLNARVGSSASRWS
jgi:branched-chain amino acid transport system substrate-binding protein